MEMNKETLERMRQMHLYGMMNAFRSTWKATAPTR